MKSTGKKLIVVTGSNKGIGYSILERLASKNSNFDFVMAVRSLSNGEKAVKNLSSSIPDAQERIKVEELDVSDPKSISHFVSNISKKFGKVDALINNAGMAFKGDAFDSRVVQETFQTNFYGTIELTDKMLDHINDNGKIITVGSMAGKFRILKSKELLEKFKDEELTREKLFGLAKDFKQAVEDNTFEEKGYPKQSYSMSKLCVNLFFTKILPWQDDIIKRNIQVYCLCPGWCRTDMAGPKAIKSADEGAETPAFLVELPWEINKEYQGQFFSDCKVDSL